MKIVTRIKTISAVLVGLIAYKTFKIYLMRRKYKHIPGPKTKGILEFFIGQYITINKYTSQNKVIGQLQQEWAKIYGPVYVYQFFDEMVCICNEEEAVKMALIDKDLPKSNDVYHMIGFPFGERFMGNGLLTELNLKRWRHRRSLFNHGFKKSVLVESLAQFNTKGNLLVKKLYSMSNNEESFSIFYEFNRMTLDVIAKVQVAFDLDIDSINDNGSKLSYFVTKSMEAITTIYNDPFAEFKPSKRELIKEIKKSIQNLRKFSKEKLSEKLKELEVSESESINILSAVLKHAKESDEIDFEILLDDFITFFVAGQETTANALSFCIFELGQNERVLKKLNEEIDTVLGQKQEITEDDLSKLIYTTSVLKEALRKWPPAPDFIRYPPEDIFIGNYNIPKNTLISVAPFQLGRNEKYFPKPEEFIPERFISDDPFSKQNKITSYTYFPFSLGPRNCIGQNFAMLEGKLVLAKFIQHFQFKLDPNQSFGITESATLRPIDGVKVFIKPKF
nr:cytochrome P450 3049E2-2 [Brachionus rubens]